jgi:hypothetical protein
VSRCTCNVCQLKYAIDKAASVDTELYHDTGQLECLQAKVNALQEALEVLAQVLVCENGTPPEQRRWEVWSEGYAATGESGGAVHHGTYLAATFKEAVLCWHDQAEPGTRALIDLERLTYWGCRLYPTEAQARRSFG